jgi:uncharacterized protein
MRFARVFPALALLVGMFALSLHAQSSFTVGTASAAPGQKATGYLQVPAGVDPGTNIPVVVFNGAKPGPTLALVAGTHGTEYASIIALEKLIPQIDPAVLSGKVILIPLVNLPSFYRIVPHLNPIDNKNMNRFFPGKADGTQTERASYLITKEVVNRCDYLIDFHGGDLDESLRPYAYWGPTGRAAQDRASKEMVLAFGLNHIIIWHDRPTDPAQTRYLDNTASTRGKPSIVVEAGHAGTTETDDIQLLVNGTLSTMRSLKMIPGEPQPIENPVWLDKLIDVTSDVDGIFYPLVKRGTFVAAGMKLGYVTDFFGNTIFVARAPEAGVILHVDALPTLKKGDDIANIGVPAGHAP